MNVRHQPTNGPGPRRSPSIVPLFNRVARRLIRLGVPLGPNQLLSVRGRKTGLVRTTPVAVLQSGGRRWVWSPYADVQWTRNLRAAGECTLTVARRVEALRAVELDHAAAERFFTEVMGPYARRTPLGAWMLGSVMGAPDVLEDPRRAAERHPVFELSTPESEIS